MIIRAAAGRVRDILFRPTRTWETIADEPGDAVTLTKTYVAPLAAIPAVCGLIGGLAFGESFMGVTYRPSIPAALAEAVVGFGLTIAAVWALAYVLNLVAPLFGAQRDFQRAFKAAAYPGTAAWVLGVFDLAPTLGALAAMLGALYGLVLLYLGLPRLMQPHKDKAVSYFAMAMLIILVLGVFVGAMTSMIRDQGGPLSVS